MAKDNFLVIDGFKGWYARDDDTRIPSGGARTAYNVTLTDRKGISPRSGEELLGSEDTSNFGIKSLYSFRKSQGDDILIRSWSNKLQFYSNKGLKWALLQDGYTSGLTFGFTESRVDKNDSLDYVVFGNGSDNFSRWCGYDATLATTLAGGETSIVVDTTLLPEVHESLTASSVTTTTIVVPAGTWATDIWNGFYVRITSGAQTGKISLISATTATQITFTTIAGLSGTPTFEIRQLAVPATGTLVYGTSKVAYTAVPEDDTFTVGTAIAASSGEVVTVAPQEFPENPKGNIFEMLDEDLYVSGNQSKPITAFRSATADPEDFTFSSPRTADQGDVIYFPYSGGNIKDIKRFESSLAILKPDSVEKLSYTQDALDVAVQDTIKIGQKVGSVGKAWTMDDDIAFVTPDSRITSIGRIKYKDSRPQSQDIAYEIRRGIKNYSFDDVFGSEYINRAFVCSKSSSDVTANDRLLVWNKDHLQWEGYWNINANTVIPHNGSLYYGDAYTPNVFKMLTGINKVKGTDTFPLTSRWISGWINGKGNGFDLNEISALAVEGYIRLNTTIDFKLYKDFSSTSFQNLQIVASEDTNVLDGESPISFLGGSPLGLEPLGGSSILGDTDSEGYRHFIAYLYFPLTQIEYVSVEITSSGTGQAWEIIRLGLNATENVFENTNKII